MKREVLNDVVPVAKGHGEFMMEFLYKAEKKGNTEVAKLWRKSAA